MCGGGVREQERGREGGREEGGRERGKDGGRVIYTCRYIIYWRQWSLQSKPNIQNDSLQIRASIQNDAGWLNN